MCVCVWRKERESRESRESTASTARERENKYSEKHGKAQCKNFCHRKYLTTAKEHVDQCHSTPSPPHSTTTMRLMRKLYPLETPEVVALVGSFMPAWQASLERLEFEPRNLLSGLAGNKTWTGSDAHIPLESLRLRLEGKISPSNLSSSTAVSFASFDFLTVAPATSEEPTPPNGHLLLRCTGLRFFTFAAAAKQPPKVLSQSREPSRNQFQRLGSCALQSGYFSKLEKTPCCCWLFCTRTNSKLFQRILLRERSPMLYHARIFFFISCP